MPASQDFIYPQPNDHDDDDVVWALQAGNVEWQRGATTDALVWLRRAIESANAAGNAFRASEIQAAVDELAEIMWGGGDSVPVGELDDNDVEEVDDASLEELSDDDLVAEEAWLEDDTSEASLDADPETMAPSALLDDVDPETMAPSALLDDADPDTIAPPPPPLAADPDLTAVAGINEYELAEGNEIGDPLDSDPADHTVLDALPPEGIDEDALPSYALEDEPAGEAPLPSYATPEPDASELDLPESDPRAPLPSYTLETELVDADPADEALPSYALDDAEADPEANDEPPDSDPVPSYAFPRGLPAIPELRRAEHDINAIVSSVPAVPLDMGIEPVDLAIATSLEESPRVNLAVAEALPKPALPVDAKPIVDGVPLTDCLGFEDLPEEIQIRLAVHARLERLKVEEELSAFGAALVTHGAAAVVTDISDEPALLATKGDVVFTEGSLIDGTKLRVVSTLDNTVIAVWSHAEIEQALKDCPWVAETLRAIADRFQALAGATLGVLGERLDAALRRTVIDRMEVRAYAPGEQVMARGAAVPGLYIVGAGRVELLSADNSQVTADLLPGDFVFPEGVLSASAASATARAGSKGALLLVANRSVAHELVTSVPPLLEALVS